MHTPTDAQQSSDVDGVVDEVRYQGTLITRGTHIGLTGLGSASSDNVSWLLILCKVDNSYVIDVYHGDSCLRRESIVLTPLLGWTPSLLTNIVASTSWQVVFIGDVGNRCVWRFDMKARRFAEPRITLDESFVPVSLSLNSVHLLVTTDSALFVYGLADSKCLRLVSLGIKNQRATHAVETTMGCFVVALCGTEFMDEPGDQVCQFDAHGKFLRTFSGFGDSGSLLRPLCLSFLYRRNSIIVVDSKLHFVLLDQDLKHLKDGSLGNSVVGDSEKWAGGPDGTPIRIFVQQDSVPIRLFVGLASGDITVFRVS